ncbi:MAG: chorismate lyase [Burkholderiales bacterium]|jgi:chorismate--pyruvate lyase|uniref:chorismate--pyruvate lyase family protein n=1 Tax=Limnobacter sp. TaxID=2003368 RepID=UPI0039383044|nr:chorismate lyase [Burkholderiales bacterium]
MSGSVKWTSHCPPSWPVWARNWASTPGSLTRRLVGLNKGFKVEPVAQGKVLIKNGPGTKGRGASGQAMRQRLVRLHVNNAPVVLAQTLVKTDGPVNDWHFWRGLGTRSLGTVLFSDPQVKRGELYFARLPLRQPWVQQLLPPALKAEMNRPGTARVWYARCARFSRKPNRTPLWVMEVFLPQLEHYL